MIIGGVITFLLQSSSSFTSMLTPMVGSGILSLERAYELTLGSNIGNISTHLLVMMPFSCKLFLTSPNLGYYVKINKAAVKPY